MSPTEYAATVVLPTIRGALGARGDQRLVYLAAIVTYHLADYLVIDPQEDGHSCRDAEVVDDAFADLNDAWRNCWSALA